VKGFVVNTFIDRKGRNASGGGAGDVDETGEFVQKVSQSLSICPDT
jgi:hypothetical protein